MISAVMAILYLQSISFQDVNPKNKQTIFLNSASIPCHVNIAGFGSVFKINCCKYLQYI